MNKKGFLDLDDINPAYILLSLVAGLIGYFVCAYAYDGVLLPIMAGVGSVITSYLYLAFTDR